MFDDSITLYNQYKDGATGTATYIRTYIKGVSWYRTAAVAVVSGGLQTAKTAVVNVPLDADTEGKKYLPYAKWEKQPNDLMQGYWTLREGDLMIRGLIDFEFKDGKRLADLNNFAGQSNVFAIYSFNDDLKGSRDIQHWRMEGR